MHLEPIKSLNWAYQLHYYFCFGTHRRRNLFSTSESTVALTGILDEICNRHHYHLLRVKVYPNHLRCLSSLSPQHDISTVVRIIKANSSREFCSVQAIAAPAWARGFLAQSAGKARIQAVRTYLDQQPEHHGYSNRVLPPVFRYRAHQPVALASAHSSFELNHHLVFATWHRIGVFTSTIGAGLGSYWLKVATKHGFAIDRISILPDHVHLLVRTVPKLSIESCAFALMNNGQHFIGGRFPDALIITGLDHLWQPSAYGATTGEVTTAQVKAFLSHEQ